MKGGLMRIMLGMAATLMSQALNFPVNSKERSTYEMQARKLSAGCYYANPEQGQFFAEKGRFHKLKGYKREKFGLTQKRRKHK